MSKNRELGAAIQRFNKLGDELEALVHRRKRALDAAAGEPDHQAAEREQMMGAPPKAEGQDAQDAEEDFSALHRLVTGAKLTGDADVRMLRDLLNKHNSKRLHVALDKVLDRLAQRRRTNDGKFLRRVGVRP
ncbi:MAG: hypothetical protein LAO30_23440 [Acidobacteriia bacterium]|nr:hypothetical protein [Terriglobia bacterium]